MAITFPSVFQSGISDDPAALAAGYLTPSRFNQGCAPAGLGTNQVLYSTGATTLAQSSNMLYSDSLLNSGPGLQIGSGSTTNAGLILGYGGSTGVGAIYPSAVTPSASNNSVVYADGTNSTIIGGTSGPSLFLTVGTDKTITLNTAGAASSVIMSVNGAQKFMLPATAGAGPAIAAGTATTDVAALSVTRTNNNAAVATGVKIVFTDTSSAAGFLPENILGGAAGTTILRQTTKTGGIYGGDTNVLIGSKATLTGGSTGNVPTLTAGPVTGNPTKWLPIDDNGTTRYVPSW